MAGRENRFLALWTAMSASALPSAADLQNIGRHLAGPVSAGSHLAGLHSTGGQSGTSYPNLRSLASDRSDSRLCPRCASHGGDVDGHAGHSCGIGLANMQKNRASMGRTS